MRSNNGAAVGVLLLFAIGGSTLDAQESPPRFVLSWGSVGPGPGQFGIGGPQGIAIDATGLVLVSDAGYSRFQRFDLLGRFVDQWSPPGWTSPGGICVDGEGNIYAADYYWHAIFKYDPSGRLIANWGSECQLGGPVPGLGCRDPDGDGPLQVGDGQVWSPTDVAIDDRGYRYVTDSGNDRIQVFDGDGRFLFKWGSRGTAPVHFRYPAGIATDADGCIYVADYGNDRVQKLDSSGALVAEWSAPGPSGIAIDSSGNVYVVNGPNHQVQKFTGTGVLLTSWGHEGTGPGEFYWPSDIVIDSAAGVFVIDTLNHRIQKFASPIAIRTSTWGELKGTFR